MKNNNKLNIKSLKKDSQKSLGIATTKTVEVLPRVCGMWVVKIGGSLLGSPELKHWLQIIAQFGDGKVVIVPGGSVFADAVRRAQQLSGIDDVVAHTLAIRAMDQFGLLLAAMNPNLSTASSELELAERSWQHRGIVWLPSKMLLADDSIPKNWQVTSDSLSAWLANKLAAEHLLIIKSTILSKYKSPVTFQKLADEHIVDASFTQFAEAKSYEVRLFNKADFKDFERALKQKSMHEQGLLIRK